MRKSYFFLWVFLLFYGISGVGYGQTNNTTPVLLDNYDGIGDLVYTENTDAQWSIAGGIFVAGTNAVTTPEHSNASYDLTGSIPDWNLSKSKKNVWIGHFKILRTTSGWGTSNYGAGAVLASNNADFSSTSAQGYALVIENGTTDKVSLIRFSQGIKDGSTNLPSNSTSIVSVAVDPGTTGFNYLVELLDDGKWKISYITGAALSDENAVVKNSYSGGAVTSNSADETYSGTSFKYSGWVFSHSTGNNATDKANFDNFGAAQENDATPSITLADNGTQIAAGNILQGATDHILSTFKVTVATANATLNSITFKPFDTYVAGDVTNYKLYTNSTNTFPGGTALKTIDATISVGGGDDLTFSSLTQVCAVGDRYFWITADIPNDATPGNTIFIPALNAAKFSFASGNPASGSVSQSGTQTIQEAVPSILLSSPDAADADITIGSVNNVLYRFDLAVTTANATLNGVTIITAGTYQATDITNLKCWYSADNIFNSGTDVLLSTKTTGLGAGSQAFPSFSERIINSGTTGYIYITTDIPYSAAPGVSISINAITTDNISFVSGSKSGTANASGTKTLIDCTPINVTGVSSTAGNATVTLSFTLPECYNEIMIVAKEGIAAGITPTGDGTSYNANQIFGSGTSFDGGYVVYKGINSGQEISGLTNNQTYHFTFFTRRGSSWSNGITITAVPIIAPIMTELVIPQYIGAKTAASTNNARTPIAMCIKIDNLSPNQSYDLRFGLALTSEANTSYGAGSMWSSSAFGTSNLSNAFTTNGSGSSGVVWIFFQPTGNSTRFDAGQVHNLRVGYVINGGTMPTSPNFVGLKTITALDISSTARTTATTDDGAFIKGTANLGASGKYVLLFNNETGSGDPLFSYQIRTAVPTSTTQSDLPVAINDIYLQAGTSVVGDYPAVIPIGGNNPNGIRRIEARNADNTIYSYSTDADGNWGENMNTTTIARRQVILIGESVVPLPVELVSFTAKVKSSAVHLQWETATEVNNYGFEVERSNAVETMHASSTQGRTWQKIGFVEGNGNSNSPKSYSFTDRNASAGKYIYRLKQIDTDGAFDYSDEVAVDLGTPAQFSLSQNYPNPFNPSTLVQYAVPVQSVVVLEIYDITGTRVAQPVNALHEPGSYSALFNLTDLNLASGTYIYRLSATDMSGNIMYSAINKMLLLK